MYIIKAEAKQIEKIVNMSIRAFETDVNVGGAEGDCPPEFDSVEWHKQMAREGHLYQAMIDNDMVGAAIVFPDETENSVYIGRIFIDSVYHGKGYGIRLMDCIEKNFPWAAEFHLDTPCWNERTNAFYKRLGYRIIKNENGFVFYQKRKNEPMEKLTENMIRFAESKLGSTAYAGWCLAFIEDALEISNHIEIFGGDSAKESCELYKDALQGGVPERGAEFVIMFSVRKIGDDAKFRKDMFKSKRKSVEEIWEGEQIPGVSELVRFAPSACNSQPWLVKNNGELLVYRYRKPGKRGIMPADKVSFYNRIDIGIFLCIMDICLGHNGVGFEKTLYSDAGDDKELVLNAKYRLCRYGDDL